MKEWRRQKHQIRKKWLCLWASFFFLDTLSYRQPFFLAESCPKPENRQKDRATLRRSLPYHKIIAFWWNGGTFVSRAGPQCFILAKLDKENSKKSPTRFRCVLVEEKMAFANGVFSSCRSTSDVIMDDHGDQYRCRNPFSGVSWSTAGMQRVILDEI